MPTFDKDVTIRTVKLAGDFSKTLASIEDNFLDFAEKVAAIPVATSSNGKPMHPLWSHFQYGAGLYQANAYWQLLYGNTANPMQHAEEGQHSQDIYYSQAAKLARAEAQLSAAQEQSNGDVDDERVGIAQRNVEYEQSAYNVFMGFFNLAKACFEACGDEAYEYKPWESKRAATMVTAAPSAEDQAKVQESIAGLRRA